jgi:hypothetical protein
MPAAPGIPAAPPQLFWRIFDRTVHPTPRSRPVDGATSNTAPFIDRTPRQDPPERSPVLAGQVRALLARA